MLVETSPAERAQSLEGEGIRSAAVLWVADGMRRTPARWCCNENIPAKGGYRLASDEPKKRGSGETQTLLRFIRSD